MNGEVWYDADVNGLNDDGPGTDGIEVRLLREADLSVVEDSHGGRVPEHGYVGRTARDRPNP